MYGILRYTGNPFIYTNEGDTSLRGYLPRNTDGNNGRPSTVVKGAVKGGCSVGIYLRTPLQTVRNRCVTPNPNQGNNTTERPPLKSLRPVKSLNFLRLSNRPSFVRSLLPLLNQETAGQVRVHDVHHWSLVSHRPTWNYWSST